MRTLLIDNHDSFTYNLYQYLAACNDELPIVIRNDEMAWSEAQRLTFDNIVISPGPGRPQRKDDLGISADALRFATVPVLGVCLGHQAIAHHCGATVGLAVQPMHGRIDAISHVGTDLFRGIPDQFEAVRYHSLAVTDLPRELAPLAWTRDGTLMALRHTSKPWWGVQFHPESICTEFGARLLRNFRELTEEWIARPRRAAPMGSFLQDFRVGHEIPLSVHARCLDVSPDAEQVFMKIFAQAPVAFWLDSSLAHESRGRFSFMGDASGPNAKQVTYRVHRKELEIRSHDIVETRSQNIFDYLHSQITCPQVPQRPLPFDFAGGFVGYFGYELRHDLFNDPSDVAPSSTPDACWLLADRFIAFDHVQKQTWIVCLDAVSLSVSNLAWMDATEQALTHTLPPSPPLDANAASGVGALRWRTSLGDYRQLIEQAQREILEGETYEVCLTNQVLGDGAIDTVSVYRALRAHSPAPYSAFLKLPQMCVLSASPELFLRVDAAGQVEARPIKGTARRGADPDEDARIKEALAADEKTRAENLMIVDLLRNDLNRVCDVGSVHVPDLFEVETYANVHQMVSVIRGQLREHTSVIDCVRASFPGGSMTGAPKERTMMIIDELEQAARGVYAGSLGYLSLNGTAQLNIVIRTIISTPEGVSIGTGGAIVSMSDTDDEVAEIVLKARAAWEVLSQCGASTGPMPQAPQKMASPQGADPAARTGHGSR